MKARLFLSWGDMLGTIEVPNIEDIFNTQDLPNHSVIFSEVLKRSGGDQGMTVNEITFPFEIIHNNILSFN